MAYVACQVNAGQGTYGAIFYDRRSAKGLALAEAVAAELRRVIRWEVRVLPAGPDTDGRAANDGERAWECIRGVRAVALCFDPGFIDSPDPTHRRTVAEDPEVFGLTLARGIAAWTFAPG